MLVEDAALARAEQECLSDAEARELARERAAERRQALDAEYVDRFARRIGELFPG
jgi:ABC-type nitrate/sulfonate/bicarbonate transport system substrate-binding protein